MELKKTLNKYLFISLSFLLIIIIYFETIMGLNTSFYKKYGYDSPFLDDFKVYYFTFSLIALLILIIYTKFGFKMNLKNNQLESVFLFGFIFDIFFGLVTLLCIYEGTLDFYEDNLLFYRITYFLILLLFLFLIYEISINKGKSIYPNLEHSNNKEKIYSESTKLHKLKTLGIIDEEIFLKEAVKIKKQKILVEIKNTTEYKEYYNSLNLALSKDFITKEIMEKKLIDKENELYEYRQVSATKSQFIKNTEIFTSNNKFIFYIIPLAVVLGILLFIVIKITPLLEEIF